MGTEEREQKIDKLLLKLLRKKVREGKKLTFLDYWSTERNKLSMPK